MIPGGTPDPPLWRVVDAPFTSKSHFGLLAVRCLSYMGWGSPLLKKKKKKIKFIYEFRWLQVEHLKHSGHVMTPQTY